MKRLTDRLDRLPRRLTVGGAVALVAAVGLFDYASGTYSIAGLYMVPCFLAAWSGGNWAGLAVTALSALTMTYTDRLLGVPQASVFWNRAVEIASLAITSLLVSALRRSDVALRDAAMHDSLTGLDNRKAFLQRAELELAVSRRDGRPMTLAFIDLDDFKALNDERGHAEGDRLLMAVATVLRRRTRASDACARIGGDEFTLILRDTDAGAAATVLAQFRAELETEMLAHGWPVAASIGAVALQGFAGTAEEALRVADGLMYQAKRAGKGSVRIEAR